MLWIEFCWARVRLSRFRVFGVQNEIRRPLHWVEFCCVASIGSAIIPAYQEDPNPWDEVCIPKAILAAQYGSAIIPAYQEDPNPRDEV